MEDILTVKGNVPKKKDGYLYYDDDVSPTSNKSRLFERKQALNKHNIVSAFGL